MKIKFIFIWPLFLVICILMASSVQGQGSDIYQNGLSLKIDSSGKKYIRFIFWNQVWMRSMQHNPGTQVNGENSNHTWDVGARRIRFLAYAQISPRYLILTHFGINNQTFGSGGASTTTATGPNGAGKKPQLFFHDAYNEFAIVPERNLKTNKENKASIYIGVGLHYWMGLSRMTAGSTLNFLTIDAPIVNWPLVEFGDQFARQYGIYIKGRIGKLNYHMHANKPFATRVTPPLPNPATGPVAVDNNGDPSVALGGYFDYQFLDQESNKLPYRSGTYLGTKKVFNIGGGFYHTKNGTASNHPTAPAQLNRHNITLLGFDVFADLPIGNKKKNMAITAYSVGYRYDFGPNYLRTLGLMNPSSGFDPTLPPGQLPLNGPGNSRVFVGTGNILYTQAGLLLPKGNKGKMRMQPFAAHTYKKFEAIDQSGHYFDAGINFFLDGHHAKITPQYSTRPVYFDVNGQKKINGTKGEFLIQVQIYL